MKIHDLSPLIAENMVTWRNKFEYKSKLKVIRSIRQGCNESRLDVYSHAGSHVDAPFHNLANGTTIENMSLEKFIGKCTVLDMRRTKNSIRKQQLIDKKNQIKKGHIILLKTKDKPAKSFDFNFTYLDKSAAEYLVSKNIKAVGIDSLGIERNQPKRETHKIFGKNNIPIFEGLDLTKVREGQYFFCGFPLKIAKGDASPIRAVLIELQDVTL